MKNRLKSCENYEKSSFYVDAYIGLLSIYTHNTCIEKQDDFDIFLCPVSIFVWVATSLYYIL